MARLDISELKAEEKRLLAELTAIRNFIAIKQGDEVQVESIPTKSPAKVKKELPKPEGIPKGGESWEGYVKIILKQIGGSGKTSDVYSYAMKANPTFDETLVLNAVRGKLSKLNIKGEINADDSGAKSEGYIYTLKTTAIPSDVKRVAVAHI